jgi:DNA-binding NarL/FixJ family response regulator
VSTPTKVLDSLRVLAPPIPWPDPPPAAHAAPASAVGESRLPLSLLEIDPVTRAGIRAILEREDLQLHAELDAIDGALSALPSMPSSILMMEAAMAADARGAAIRAVVAAAPGVKVVVFGMGTREEEVFNVFDAGAVGYLRRSDLASDLAAAIRAIERGERYVPGEVRRRLMDRERRPALTPRERDVLGLLADARSNASIAAVLGISVGTVKLHVKSILAKLGAEDRVEAIVLAIERGFVRSK